MVLLPRLMMSVQGIKYGKKCRFHGMPIITKQKNARITIGDGSRFRSGVLSNLIGLYQRTIIVAKGQASIDIGKAVGMSGVTIYAREGIRIGDKTLIGANTKILDNDFHPVDPNVRQKTPGSNMRSAPIQIGDNVFIGCNCLILKGVTIGDNTTIGAGSVVTKNIPANCIAGGNPAIVIKCFDEDVNP